MPLRSWSDHNVRTPHTALGRLVLFVRSGSGCSRLLTVLRSFSAGQRALPDLIDIAGRPRGYRRRSSAVVVQADAQNQAPARGARHVTRPYRQAVPTRCRSGRRSSGFAGGDDGPRTDRVAGLGPLRRVAAVRHHARCQKRHAPPRETAAVKAPYKAAAEIGLRTRWCLACGDSRQAGSVLGLHIVAASQSRDV